MNRPPPSHLEQGCNQVTTTHCDMNYQLNHPFHNRMDQPQPQPQHQNHHQHHNHHHQNQHNQHHQLPIDTLGRGVIHQNGGITNGFGQRQQQEQHHHHQNYHQNCNNQHGRSGGSVTISSGHIYGHYPQQVSTANQQHHHHHHHQQHQQHMYVGQQQLNSDPTTSVLYRIPSGQSHENMPFVSPSHPCQTNYESNILHVRNHMHQEPMQTPSQLYNNPTIPSARVAPQMHLHEQYANYNDDMVMMAPQPQMQQQQQQHHHYYDHNHQLHRPIQPEENYLAMNHGHLHQEDQQQHSGVIGVPDGASQYDGAEIIDQNQMFYQQQQQQQQLQEQMDSLPTIKQQQQMQQQQQQLQQQLHLRHSMGVGVSPIPVSMGYSMAPAISMDSYGAKIVGGQTQSQQVQQLDTTVANLMIPSKLKQQPQATQVVSQLKPNLAASPPVSSLNKTFDTQQQQLQRRTSTNSQRHGSALSTTSYLNSDNQLQQQQHHHHHHQQRITSSSIGSNESDSVAQTRGGGSGSDSSNSATGATRRGHQVDDFVDIRLMGGGAVSQDWLDTICRHLIDHMNRFGICVIDNFLGSTKGQLILEEVQQLFNSGQYTRGMLVNSKLNTRPPSSSIAHGGAGSGGGDGEISGATAAIRNDRVIWIDGYEDGCSEINNLIQTLCSVITNSSRLSLYSNNGLDKIVINKRTKAHVACYPGNGTRYIKHVDNPNGDGRVITSIYYLNKDWNTKRDGGLLRMFPVGMNEVANIEPLFDRVLFFWSDRRNPHEVLPAYSDRFAITVWYIGANRPT